MIQTKQEPIEATILPGIERFDSRQDFTKRTGAEPPPFNPLKPKKYWRDPAAPTSRPRVTYQRTLMRWADGTPVIENGEPVFEPISMTPAEAAAVNIPSEEDDIRALHDPDRYGYKGTLAVPLRELEGDEYYAIPAGVGGATAVVVRRRSLWDAATPRDPLMEVLLRVEKKLDQALSGNCP